VASVQKVEGIAPRAIAVVELTVVEGGWRASGFVFGGLLVGKAFVLGGDGTRSDACYFLSFCPPSFCQRRAALLRQELDGSDPEKCARAETAIDSISVH
jgi:hypothetical protein